MLLQVVRFNCSLDYYSPQDITSQESQFSILPQCKVMIEIYPPIYNQWNKKLCLQLQNTSNKIILVLQQSILYNILKHPSIQHCLLWVDPSVIHYLKQRWQNGIYTYVYLKYAFTINNARLGCGGIGVQCPM
jgi:hypothetical protein